MRARDSVHATLVRGGHKHRWIVCESRLSERRACGMSGHVTAVCRSSTNAGEQGTNLRKRGSISLGHAKQGDSCASKRTTAERPDHLGAVCHQVDSESLVETYACRCGCRRRLRGVWLTQFWQQVNSAESGVEIIDEISEKRSALHMQSDQQRSTLMNTSIPENRQSCRRGGQHIQKSDTDRTHDDAEHNTDER